MRVFLLPVLILGLGSFAAAQSSDNEPGRKLPKLTADEIVKKHLASIGTPDALSGVKTRIMTGVGTFTTKNRPGKIGGPAQFATDGQKIILAMVLNSNDYPFEKIGFDGKDLTTAALPAGGSSPLSEFLKNNKLLVKRGLFGGVLGGGWPLLQRNKDVKLEAAGTARLGEQNVYKLKVSTSGIADMTISLYFDAETFRHVRSEYFYRISEIMSPNPNRPVIIGAGASSYTLTEDFSDFMKVDDLVLPLNYIVEYTSDAGKPLVWTIKFSQTFNNQPLDAAVFNVS